MTALLTLLGLVGSITLLVVGGLLVAEARGQTIHRARGIARRAAHSLPPEYRERYAEEWEAVIADLAERPLSALGQALSLQVGARRLARELVAAPALSGSQTKASQPLPPPAPSRLKSLSRLASQLTRWFGFGGSRRSASLAKVSRVAERLGENLARFERVERYARWIALGAGLAGIAPNVISLLTQ